MEPGPDLASRGFRFPYRTRLLLHSDGFNLFHSEEASSALPLGVRLFWNFYPGVWCHAHHGSLDALACELLPLRGDQSCHCRGVSPDSNTAFPVGSSGAGTSQTRGPEARNCRTQTHRAGTPQAKDDLELKVLEGTAELRKEDLLAEIAQRKQADEALRRSRDELEMKVKERTAELRKLNEEFRSVNKDLEAFAYSVSHDLRAPVRHIAGFTEFLQKRAGPVLDAKSKHHIDMILESTNRMGNMVDDLLAFSRIGCAETQKTSVNLEQLVKSVIDEIAPDTASRKINWRIGHLPSCYGDSSMLRLVFSNLVSNAVKFTRTREQAEIEIDSLNHSPNEIVVFVKDNGVGFDMKYKDKLFGVFRRLHSQKAFEGTGIGLATVQRIVHRHGGRVWGQGAIDNGATFYVALPKPGKANL
jgi:signal transduction histidine kinase